MSAPLRVIRADGNSRAPRGLPAPLPKGEALLWQGGPSWTHVAFRVLHVRKLMIYFAILAMIALVRSIMVETQQMWWSLFALIFLGMVALTMLCVFAYFVAKTTVYTITEKRVVLRIGVAIGMSLNLPFKMIESADLRLFADGSGDIPLLLTGETRVGYITLWPHARPWKTRRVQPMLRSVPDAARVAQLLARALAAHSGQAVATFDTAPSAAAQPAGAHVPASAAMTGD
ncbi:MAG: PH domain-containing protein [Proteobacteria bacterium]|nr:PH domain-containing protein [Pseudomonadota bacterium]